MAPAQKPKEDIHHGGFDAIRRRVAGIRGLPESAVELGTNIETRGLPSLAY